MAYPNRNKWYKYNVKAVNPDGDTSSYSAFDSSRVLAVWDSVKANALDTMKIQVYSNPDTFATGKYFKTFAYDQYKTSDTIWGDSVIRTATFYNLYTDSITLRDSLNHKWYVRGVMWDSSGVRYYSDLDSVRTKARPILSTSLSWVTDTSFTLTITSGSNLPATTGMFIIDSQRAADSTKKYLHPDSTSGFFTTKQYTSKASITGKTIKILHPQLSSGLALKIRVVTANVDSFGRQ